MWREPCFAALLAASLAYPAAAQGPKKIVFAAGPKDHGAPGRHEYEKDLASLKGCLDNSSNVKNVATKLFAGKAPEVSELKDTAVLVLSTRLRIIRITMRI